jgi:hypothetical protein
MAHLQIPMKRLVLSGGLALAALAAPVALMATSTGTALAACTSGEETDVFTTSCVPYLVPTSNQGFTTTAANPDIPEIDGIPATGGNSGSTIGLEEDAEAAGPAAVPRSTFESSP